MAEKVIMPQLGLTMKEGKIIRWIKNEGDKVIKDEPIAEIESDKASFELEAPASGTLIKIVCEEGSVVPITETIAYIGKADEKIRETEQKEQNKALEKLGETKEVSAKKSRNNYQTYNDNSKRILISPRARKAARENGIPKSDFRNIKGTGLNGRIVERDVLAWIEKRKIRATPLAEKIAHDKGIDLSSVEGSDIRGKIVSKDVLGFDISSIREMEEQIIEIPLEGIKKVVAERMFESWQTKPHVTLTTEIDMTDTLQVRKQLNDVGEDFKISVNDIIVKVCAMALRKHPNINAVMGEQGIKLLQNVNVGIAVAIKNGLIVPVINNADKKSLKQISQEAKEKINRAREGKLLPDEMSNGTFTVSNLGMYGIDAFTPIINPPETAILGVGRLIKKPAVYNDEVTIRTLMYLSISFDHRVIDGAPAAEFLSTIRELLENPYKLILEG